MGPDLIWDSEAWREFIAPIKDGALFKYHFDEDRQMTIWRSREIVEAVQWFPGKEIKGVVETKDGRAVLDPKEAGCLGFVRQPIILSPGDYVGKNKWGHIDIYKRGEFEKDFEDVGG